MTFQVSLLLTADGDIAAAEVRKVGAAVKETGAEAEKLGSKGRTAAGGIQKLGNSADRAEDQVKKLAAAERQATRDAQELQRSNMRAAGATGNLIAQFNDIGMMMMAGQNPLQLAVQQGTQITQVIGPMGAAGAARALGGALLGMLSPINLVTIGSIAAGAAMVNWLASSVGAAEDLDDLLDRLNDHIDQTRKNAELGSAAGAQKMMSQYGAVTTELRALASAREELARAMAKRDLSSTMDAVFQSGKVGWLDTLTGFANNQEGQIRKIAHELGVSKEQAEGIQNAFAQLEEASGPEEKAKAFVNLRDRIVEASGGYDTLNKKAETLVGLLNDVQDAQSKFGAASNASAVANATALSSLWQGLKKSATEYADGRKDEAQSAIDILKNLREQNAIQEAIWQHGERSAEVTKLREQAERRSFEEMVNSLGVADDLKKEIMAAFDEGQKLAELNMTSGISAAADAAERLALQLGVSFATAMGIVNLQGSKTYSGRGGDPRAFDAGGNQAGYQNQLGYTPIDEIIERFNRQNRRGGSGTREAEALARLIAREQEQLDLLRATDPVQRELIRNREVLAGATDAERTAVQALIAERIAEQEAMEGLQERQDFFNQTLYDSMSGLILRGESLEDVLGNIGRALAEAALQAAILGEGPLAKLFGWTTPLFKFSSGGEIPALASGGQVYGPGGGTDDKVLMWGSSGEFMMNAKATSRYRHLLEAMNAGAPIPGFATGGAIGGGAASAPALGGMAHLKVELSNDLKATMLSQSAGIAAEISQNHIETYDRELPRRVRAINDDPGRIG